MCANRQLLIFRANNMVRAFIFIFTMLKFKSSNIKNEFVTWAFLNKYFLYLQKVLSQ